MKKNALKSKIKQVDQGKIRDKVHCIRIDNKARE